METVFKVVTWKEYHMDFLIDYINLKVTYLQTTKLCKKKVLYLDR